MGQTEGGGGVGFAGGGGGGGPPWGWGGEGLGRGGARACLLLPPPCAHPHAPALWCSPWWGRRRCCRVRSAAAASPGECVACGGEGVQSLLHTTRLADPPPPPPPPLPPSPAHGTKFSLATGAVEGPWCPKMNLPFVGAINNTPAPLPTFESRVGDNGTIEVLI